jgi:GNAT superfamily N-acetyltransferase
VRSLFAPSVPPRQWRVRCLESTADLSPASLSALLACQNAADLADRPGDPPTCAAEMRALLATPYQGQRVVHLLHDEAGTLVAWARLGLYNAFHPELAHAAMTVHPAARRRGAGSALLAALSDTAVRHGRDRLVLDGPRTAAAEAFATRHAFTLSSRELRSRLDLDRIQVAAPRSGGFIALRWTGPCPDRLIETYVCALDALHAQSAGPPGAPFTAAEIHHREQLALTAGLREYTACLVNPRRKQIVALSSAHTADGLRGEQNETVVIPQYRGLGLAALVKTQLIRELLGAERRLAVLDTYNAVDNVRMLAVNRRLGFRPLDTHAAWTLRLRMTDSRQPSRHSWSAV